MELEVFSTLPIVVVLGEAVCCVVCNIKLPKVKTGYSLAVKSFEQLPIGASILYQLYL